MAQDKDVLLVRESFVPVANRAQKRKVFVARGPKSKEQSLLSVLCAWIVEHQIGLSINLLTLLALVHGFFPRARPHTRKFFELSYYDSKTGLCSRGWDDMYLVSFWIVVFTGLRAGVMDYVLTPLAQRSGIRTKKARTRFAEQAWMVIYYSVFWTVGMYIMYNSPYWLNLKEMWSNFPTQHITPLLKRYYLLQFAFYLQLLFVVNIEERRKDHWQMFTHHVFTSALVFASYGFYQTNVGNVILCIMDVVDIILPTAKLLNYLHYQTACDIAFGVFLVVWFITRHIFYNLVCWSLIRDVGIKMPYGCYNSQTGALISTNGGSSILANVLQPFNDPSGPVCFNSKIRWGFLGLLSALQVLTLLWFGMICRVAYNVLSGKSADDVRSDDEDGPESYEEEEEADFDFDTPSASEKASQHANSDRAEPIEVEVDGQEISGNSATRSRSNKRGASARASAISIPGHSDRKELLGRIGCDKPS